MGTSICDESDGGDIVARSDEVLILSVVSCEKLDDELIPETFLPGAQEVVKLLHEIAKDFLDQYSLLSWRQLLVEIELLNNHVVIVVEGILHILHDLLVKTGLQIVGSV